MSRTLIFSILLLFTGCSDTDKKPTIKFQGSTMGTQYHITLVLPNNQHIYTDKLKNHVDNLLLDINQQMSTYIPTSEISLFNHHKQQNWFSISNDFMHVVSSAQRVSKQSNGAFDVTIAPLIDLWGFGAKTQLSTPATTQVALTLKNTGYQLLEIRQSPPALRKLNNELRIDLSAIAKGFSVDKISAYLKQKQYTDFLVEIGGEIYLQGKNEYGKPWRIGIESPNLSKSKAKTPLYLSNAALATSGDYRTYFMKEGIRYSHIINPITGKPITHKLASVTVLHESTMMADAYATALMVLGEVEGKQFAVENGLRVNMIIRDGSGYRVWQNIK